MLSLSYDFFIGSFCKHKFKIIQTGPLNSDGYRYGTYFIQQCEHCGKIKTTKSS
jgi:hypothetical protein